MAFDNYADGAILTAGSLNTSLNRRLNFVGYSNTASSNANSGTNVTIKDVYVTSGTLNQTNQLYINAALFATSATDADNAHDFRISMGPSGTSPTLTVLGSYGFNTRSTTDSSVGGALMAVGSTTIDNASVPAL